MNVESALRETVRLSSHLVLARREGEILGDSVTAEESWSLRELLDVAYPTALALGDRHLGFEHVLLAWTEEPAGPVHALVDENGLREQMLHAVAAMRPAAPPG
jgi:hypothetical protein